MAFSDYTSSASAQTGPSHGIDAPSEYWGLERLKRSYTDYLNSKTDEVEEQKNARRYRHASQWTADQIKIFNKRKQPIVTYNRIGRKIDGVVGLIEKLKQSPKAFPRTPKEEQGANLVTAVIRSVLDAVEWKAKCPIIAENAAVDGFAGIELLLVAGDEGDPDIDMEIVENDGFFYDPRSIRHDFSDARFMGQGKWLDLDAARELYPDHASEMEDAMESATDLSTNSDRENKWFITDGNIKRIRIVDEWYLMNNEWCFCVYTGNMKLVEGKSPFHDDAGKTFCKYVMFSAYVDQDGDRYGFVRNLKSAQDEINQRRSKGLHLLNTRRIIAEQGAFDDIEITRRESARPDGIVIRNKGFEAEFDDTAKIAELNQQMEFMVDAKAEIENFGPNPALIGQGALGDKSGRAIQLLQQAGVAELGPYLTGYRGWKIRVYRAVWGAVREHWRGERYVRVTDDENVLQFIGINQVSIDPMTGMPAMVNQLGKLDVDIIMDEGPDSITMMGDTYEGLLALAQNGAQVPPDVLIELNPGIDHDTKKRIIERLNAPNPQAQLQQQGMQAEIGKVVADTELSKAKAMDLMRGDQGGPQEHPMVTMSEIENKQADTAHKKAQALKTMQEAMIVPTQASHDMEMDREQANQGRTKMALDQHNSEADRSQGAYESERDHRQAAHESERDKPANDPKLSLEMRKLELEEKRMQMEREEKEKDRQVQRETSESQMDFKASQEGFKRHRTTEAERKAKTLESGLGTLAKTFAAALNKLDKKLDRLESKVDDVAEDQKAEIKIERGRDGRVASVSKGKRKMTVARDKTGKAVGLSTR
jgi:hypothetical protein